MSATKIRRPGVAFDLAYDMRGHGLPTVQLHGLTSSRRRDETLGLDLTAGLAGLEVLRYDACGHGESTGTTDPLDYMWPRLADDLTALLDEVYGDRPVHGVGQSMGAATLLHAAVRQPERFASLTLSIPPTAWASRQRQAAQYVAAADLVADRGVAEFAEATRDVPPPPAVRPDRPFTYPDVTDGLLPSVLRGAALSDLPAPEEIAALTVPTLVLAWTGDPSHPVRVARELHALVAGSRLLVARSPAEVEAWPAAVADLTAG